MAGDYTPKYRIGTDTTYQASAAVAAGNVVVVTAAGSGSTPPTAAPSGAASALVLGVATKDAAIGEQFAVSRGGVQQCVSGAAIAFGDPLKSAASGRVVPYVVGTDPVTQLIGFALSAAGGAAVTVDVQWKA